jgi:lysophospholipase L1-like esterase
MESLRGKRILCFGDSFVWGFIPGSALERYPEGVRWTSLLAQQTGATVIEEGLNGRTTVFDDPLLPYAKGIDAIESCVLSQVPLDLIVIMLGTNDLKTYVANCAIASARGVIAIACKARSCAPGVPILVVSPPPISRHITELDPALGLMEELDEKSIRNSEKLPGGLSLLCQENGFEFMKAGDVAEPSPTDCIHFDESGHAALAKAIAERAEEILG